MGKVLKPLQRLARKMVLIREARSWILKATPAENPGVGGGGGGRVWSWREVRKKEAPALLQAHPRLAPHLPGGSVEKSGPRADKRRVYHSNWVAGEDPGATEQEAEEQPEQVGSTGSGAEEEVCPRLMKRGERRSNRLNKVHSRLEMTFGLVRSAPPPAAAPSRAQRGAARFEDVSEQPIRARGLR